MANIYVFSGANGSGKTTTAFEIMPNFLEVFEYVNADEIAKGLSPFNPESVAIQAGKIMLKRLNHLKSSQQNFAFETTLSGHNYIRFLRECKQLGYTINLLFFWLNSPDLAISRVKQRVKAGGHNIPENIIYRRYHRGLNNLFNYYLPMCDNWFIYDNSQFPTALIAKFSADTDLVVVNQSQWTQFNTNYL
ncbi:zeta toxin family protein [Cyanobacterium stanieri LEGE 03274]|uniref:UDP-N-acetylglucosamine kinase n=1 Tax=Cyanobacterium stanieri LEGE 03274 TaxID=1828756 RepID=A0ABR9V2T8_9CHRO|nr:zeta toxin family protein [Cyanobacterium stanieri]MBE9221421.1 zeta toxin family protein [Cyanobacterium stanieri LEGE 03274]